MKLFELLKDQIDIEQVPFSDRGSRLLVYKEVGKSLLYIKLAERLMRLDPALEAHVHRPPFIWDLSLLNANGDVLDFNVDTSPSLLEFNTTIGKFELAFRDTTKLAFGLPDNSTSGIRFKVQTNRYSEITSRGKLKPIRFVSHATNGQIVQERITPEKDGHFVEILIQSNEDCTLQLHFSDEPKIDHGIPPLSEIRAET